MNTYRNAFISTLVVAALLAVGLVYFWSKSRHKETAQQPSAQAQASSGQMQMEGMQSAKPVTQTASQSPLAPVQLSPQRLQSIGVKFSQVQRKAVRDSLRVSGNVDINEERIAYVQTRFQVGFKGSSLMPPTNMSAKVNHYSRFTARSW